MPRCPRMSGTARGALFAALLCLPRATSVVTKGALELDASGLDDARPIRKVINLLTEMKGQVEKDAKADQAAYDKYMCWCETNRKEKSEALKAAEQHIEELAVFIEESAARAGALKTEIAGIEDEMAADREALATATSVRKEERTAFLASEADMKETRQLLGVAMKTLMDAQLLQKGGNATEGAKAATTALLQVRNVIQQRLPQFGSVLQRDLFDMMGALDGVEQSRGRRVAALQRARLLPWEKTAEQVGAEAKPSDLEGQSAGSKSYNGRSGGIIGILREMEGQFSRDLGRSQREDLEAEVTFQKLRSSKVSEIAMGEKHKGQKEAALSDTLNKAAQAKADKAATEEAVEADNSFMMNLEKNCKTEDEEYKSRVAIRSEELRALGEALKILNEDTARDLYAKTMGFLQVDMNRSVSSSEQRAALERSVKHLAEVARRHRNWALASLASRVRLDTFGKVKEVMDKMLAELASQQKEEYAKWELCKKSIDETEDSIKEGENKKEDLATTHATLKDAIATLNKDVAGLKEDVASMMSSLKAAGEDRKEENQLFQTSVADQRATVNILKKVVTRLRAFYGFSQAAVQKPGAPVSAPPASPKDYQKNAGAGGVLQLMDMIIKDAEVAEQELVQDEQKSQADYAELAAGATASIEADRKSIQQKEALAAETASKKSDTEEDQASNDEALAKQNDLLKAHHLECDYVLKYFDVRQQARQEEMDSIKDAKAILSGSSFGK